MSETVSQQARWSAKRVWGLGIFALAILSALVWHESQRGFTKEELERVISAEILKGADRAQVKTWFVRHRIRNLEAIQLSSEDVPSIECGLIEGPEANVGFLESGRIDVYFYFDKQGRVIGHEVQSSVRSL